MLNFTRAIVQGLIITNAVCHISSSTVLVYYIGGRRFQLLRLALSGLFALAALLLGNLVAAVRQYILPCP